MGEAWAIPGNGVGGRRDPGCECVGDRPIERLARVTGQKRDGGGDPVKPADVEAEESRVGVGASAFVREERPGAIRRLVQAEGPATPAMNASAAAGAPAVW